MSCTVLVDGRRYLTVVRRLIAVSIGDIKVWCYDADVTCVSRIIFSTLHWSVLTVYFKRKPPASVYAIRNEHFSHPVSFHVMPSVSVAAPLFHHADVNETYKRTGRGRSWPPDADSLRNYIASLNNPTPVPVPDRDRRIRRNQYLLTVMELVVRRPRWPPDCAGECGDPERIGGSTAFVLFEPLLWTLDSCDTTIFAFALL